MCSARIKKIVTSTTEKRAIVDEDALSKLRKLVEDYRAAKDAAEVAAQAFKEDDTLLSGTGSDVWKELFKAARKFCEESHPDKEFPHLGAESQCPLCQEPLNAGAERLISFDKFIHDEAEKKAESSKEAVTEEYKVFIKKDLSLGLDDELFAEIKELDKSLADDTRTFEKAIGSRREEIKKACASYKWDEISPVPDSPAVRLQTLIDKLESEANTFEKASDEKARAAMQKQFDELDARLKFAQVKQAVLVAIEKMALQAKLTKCLGAVKTNMLSKKASELTEKVISKELADELNKEFKALGAGNLQVALHSRSVKGKALHKLKLELSQSKKPADILSEGEQRAIAIGSFLAEVNIGGGSGGVIFDDPVSSLDHTRRERVALRLVQEANKRQVIIFTHDVYFLCILMEEASRAGVACLTQSLSKRPEGYGVSDPILPFEAMGTKARVSALRKVHQEISVLHKDGDEKAYRKQAVDVYRELRITWERAVEEILFRGVVTRFSKGVSTQKLSGVVVEDSDYVIIESEMSKCSNHCHDQALLGGAMIPEPDELLADINILETWRVEIEARTPKVIKERKAALKPEPA